MLPIPWLACRPAYQVGCYANNPTIRRTTDHLERKGGEIINNDISYWIYITNSSSSAVGVEVRYSVLDGDKEP